VTRLLSGIILIAAVLAIIWFAPPHVFLAAVVAVVVMAFLEYAGLVAETGQAIPRVVGLTAASMAAVAVGLPGAPVAALFGVIVIAICAVSLASGPPAQHVPATVATTLFPALYVGLPLGLLAAVRFEYGREAVLFVIAVVVISDTAQFYVGSTLGRHRLSPVVSPKKSVEGAIGGLVASAVVTGLVGHVAWPSLGPGWLAALGAVLATMGIVGDLFESLLKRSAAIKDSSSLIPGHGGVLDRIDSLLVVIPGYYVFLRFLN
jgi:phosphatidate cytidylyltransferase